MEAMALDFGPMVALAPVVIPEPQRPALKGTAKRIWLLLFSEGGTWTAAEIAQMLRLNLGDRESYHLHSMLGGLARDGFIMRRRVVNIDDERVVKYYVTDACKVPRGVVLAEIQELLRMAVGQRGC